VTHIVTNVSDNGLVSVLTDTEGGKRIGLADNEHEGWVTFTEVKGCTDGSGKSINDVKRFRARAVYDKYTDAKGKQRE